MKTLNAPNGLGFYISCFGMVLLLFKLIGIPVVLGYFAIGCIIAWPLTIIICVLMLVGLAFCYFIITDYIKIRYGTDRNKIPRNHQ